MPVEEGAAGGTAHNATVRTGPRFVDPEKVVVQAKVEMDDGRVYAADTKAQLRKLVKEKLEGADRKRNDAEAEIEHWQAVSDAIEGDE